MPPARRPRVRRLFQVLAAVALALTAQAGGSPQAQVLAGMRRSAADHPAAGRVATSPFQPAATATAGPAARTPSATPAPVVIGMAAPRSFDSLSRELAAVQSATGAHLSAALVELGGADPQDWSVHGDDPFTAASTYKLPLLMAEAELIAAGTVGAGDQICYLPDDWEDGWFDDYAEGVCYSRAELAIRAGHYSDNTAAHMLVRSLGGTPALNAYAAAHGASESAFFDPNTTTATDLARLMADEATGQAGAVDAQQWLYPILTHTAVETGIPAGVPAGQTVVHKSGEYESVTNDVALVVGGPNGPYVLAVCVDGLGGDAGMNVVAQVSSLVWQTESSR